ncbi:hypothetical protein AAMO2058_001254200 [Amorphochlora amoebiformis]
MVNLDRVEASHGLRDLGSLGISNWSLWISDYSTRFPAFREQYVAPLEKFADTFRHLARAMMNDIIMPHSGDSKTPNGVFLKTPPGPDASSSY